MRPERVDDAAPVHADLGGAADLAADGVDQADERAPVPRVEPEAGPGRGRRVPLGQQAAAGEGVDRRIEAALLEHEDDVDGGEAGAQDGDRQLRADAVQRVLGQGLGT